MSENGNTKLKDNADIGTVKIADDVVARIAGLAALEVEGVSAAAGDITAEQISRAGKSALSKGVKVQLNGGSVEFHPEEDMNEQEVLFSEWSDMPLSEKDASYVRQKYENVMQHLSEIDARINEKTIGWNTGRMGKVDVTVMRLALYEMLYDETVPQGVAISEAVELAKKYGQDDSPSFVNGVLAKFARPSEE